MSDETDFAAFCGDPQGRSQALLLADAQRHAADAQQRINAVVAVIAEYPILVDPRLILHALGLTDPCACPEGECSWDCPVHSVREVEPVEMATLLGLARPATRHVQGTWAHVYDGHPDQTHHDGLLANVISLLVARLRPGLTRDVATRQQQRLRRCSTGIGSDQQQPEGENRS